jgi:choline dehydrogenase
VSGVAYQYRGKMPDRPPASNEVEAEVYLSSGVDGHSTDINLVLDQFPIATPEAAARFGAPREKASRSHPHFASTDCRDAPIIVCNHRGTDRDLAAIVRAIEAAREPQGCLRQHPCS